MEEHYGEDKAGILWKEIQSLCLKTILAVLPIVQREYRQTFPAKMRDNPGEVERSRCFQILGVDVMVDRRLRPWLVECNIMPSYATDSALDAEVKGRLISQTLSVIQARESDQALYRLAMEDHKEKEDRAQHP